MSWELLIRHRPEDREFFERHTQGSCPSCERSNSAHRWITWAEMESFERMEISITICDPCKYLAATRGESVSDVATYSTQHWKCYIHKPIQDPCDEEYIRDISS